MTNKTEMNFDDILDQSIDDLADLPEFKIPFTGMYRLTVTAETKEINKKPAVATHFVVVDLIELADSSIPEEERSKPGDKFDIAYILKDDEGNKNEIGEGSMKKFLLPFHEHFGDKSIRNVIMTHLATPVSITAKVERRERKKEEGKFDARISDVVID